MIDAEIRAARLASAQFVLAHRNIPHERIGIDERGVVYQDSEQVGEVWRMRATVLSMIILECAGYIEVEPDITRKMSDNQLYSPATRWVADRLRKGEVLEVISSFLEFREQLK